MALHMCGKLAKVYLAIMNVTYVVVGFILVGIGVAFFVEKDEFQVLTGDNNLIVGLGFIAGGVFTSLVAFLGVISTIGELSGLLVVYSLLTFGLIGLELASAAFCYVERHEITKVADTKFNEFMTKYHDPSSANYSSKVNEVIDVVQSALHCCGVSGYKTWQLYNPDYVLVYGYPGSCHCSQTDKPNCIEMVKNGDSFGIWEKGCNETFYGAIGENFASIGSAGLVIGLIQVLTSAIAILLCATIIHANAKDRHDARIRAAAYTQLDSYGEDEGDADDSETGNGEEHEQLHSQHQMMQSGAFPMPETLADPLDTTDTTDTSTPSPTQQGGAADYMSSGTLMTGDGSSSPFITTHTLDHEMGPNDFVDPRDSSMYIK